MAKSTKNYISGGAKQVTFPDGGSVINVDLKLEDLMQLPVSERGYIRIVVAPRRDVDTYGNTHSVYENTFVPDKTKASGGAKAGGKPTVGFPKGGRVPF